MKRRADEAVVQLLWCHITLLTFDSGGAIGAGLFIGSGGAFQTGGPGSVLLGFIIIGKFERQVRFRT